MGMQVLYWLLGLGIDGDDGRGCRACLAPGQVLGGGEEAVLEVEGELSGVDIDHSDLSAEVGCCWVGESEETD